MQLPDAVKNTKLNKQLSDMELKYDKKQLSRKAQKAEQTIMFNFSSSASDVVIL